MNAPDVTPELPSVPYLVLYDGVCGLCNHAVQFILKRDPPGRFHFVPLQSAAAQAVLERHELHSPAPEPTYDSFILLLAPGTPQESALIKWQAALRTAEGLGGGYKLLARCAFWIPLRTGNWIYDQIAVRRYRWFGKHDTCLLPSPSERTRFYGLEEIASPHAKADGA